MCDEVFGILHSNVHRVSGDAYQIVARDDEYFLMEVITPIYNVLMMVSTIHKLLISFAACFQICAPETHFCIWWERKQREVTKERQAIPVGEIMTILMSTFGKCFTKLLLIWKMKMLKTLLKAIFVYIGITRSSNLSFSRSDKCFKIGWPMNLNADFFRHDETQPAHQVSIYFLLLFSNTFCLYVWFFNCEILLSQYLGIGYSRK